jgi:hypothetical protein
VNELVEAADEKQLNKTIARYGRVELLCIDELGYMGLDRHRAELLFQVLTEREEKNSVAIASNESFGKPTCSGEHVPGGAETSRVHLAEVLVLVTDDALIDPALWVCGEVALGKVQGVLGGGQDRDLPSPRLLLGVQGRELGDVEEVVGADVFDITQIDRHAGRAGAEGDPAKPLVTVAFDPAEELLDLLSAPEGGESE